MINEKRVLAVIPARGGSKGVPQKNIRLLNGKPLIAWTIETAQRSKYIDKLILSSDNSEIIQTAKEYGCEVPFVRPAKLARDDTPGIDPILHAIDHFPEYDYIVVLQPTSPLRITEDIDQAIESCVSNKSSSCVSVVQSDIVPYWLYQINSELQLTQMFPEYQLLRRQDAPTAYLLNGAVYVSTKNSLIKNKTFLQSDTIAYQMPKARSVDIDTIEDFLICEAYLNYHF